MMESTLKATYSIKWRSWVNWLGRSEDPPETTSSPLAPQSNGPSISHHMFHKNNPSTPVLV